MECFLAVTTAAFEVAGLEFVTVSLMAAAMVVGRVAGWAGKMVV